MGYQGCVDQPGQDRVRSDAVRGVLQGQRLAFNLAGIVGGAVPPLISAALLAAYGSWAIGVMMAILVVASLLSTYLLPETMGSDLEQADTH